MKKILIAFFLSLVVLRVNAQLPTANDTTTRLLDSVVLRSFELNKNPRLLPAQICALPAPVFSFSNKGSLLNGLNTVAGVRMEERSPGSYRLNIRGSSLRSPFGVRNVKVYWNGFPVTDPGGNTYFNQFAANNFTMLEIVKGPVSSAYGAGTGGLLMMETEVTYSTKPLTVEYNAGNYNQHNLFITAVWRKPSYRQYLSYAHNSSGGYRTHSSMRRDNFSWFSESVKNKHTLRTVILLNDMQYQTPGGLTLTEYNKNPRAARPASGAFPSAEDARAAIYQQNLYTGISNKWNIASRFFNQTTVSGSFTSIKNPAIRNYEKRAEPSASLRSIFQYSTYWGNLKTVFTTGGEFQLGNFRTRLFTNKNGSPENLQTDDKILNRTSTIFLHQYISTEHWYILAGAGINDNKLAVTRQTNIPVTAQKRNYRSIITPRLSIKRDLGDLFQLSFTTSKGYSPPTVSEVLPSTGVISTNLEAEYGWNFESTLYWYTKSSRHPRINANLTAFIFRLQEALVQRRDASGADFFINAGAVDQRGLEVQVDVGDYMPGRFIRRYEVRTDISVNHYRYKLFSNASGDFSGNKVPSVPASAISVTCEMELRPRITFRMSFYRAARIYLNDANTAFADPYHLMGMQVSWKKKQTSRLGMQVYAGTDNLFNEVYSAGNDINAAGGRYYNTSLPRSFYAGIAMELAKKTK